MQFPCAPSYITSLGFNISTTGNLSTEIQQVQLWQGSLLVGTSGFANSVTFSGSPLLTNTNFSLEYVLSPRASGTVETTLPGANVSGYSDSGFQVLGPQADSGILTVKALGTATPTPTTTPPLTFTPTDTITDTPTISPTPVNWTFTPTPSLTTPPGGGAGNQPSLLSNPARGLTATLMVPALNPSATLKAMGFSRQGAGYPVKVQVYTIGQRKVKEAFYPNALPGSSVTLDLIDKGGAPLANGLYFVAVTTPNGKSILKLLVLR